MDILPRIFFQGSIKVPNKSEQESRGSAPVKLGDLKSVRTAYIHARQKGRVDTNIFYKLFIYMDLSKS